MIQSIDKKNIILTGFMGTGKSSVGKIIAKKLKRNFVDTDLLIEKRQGRTIPEIFREMGESAFRRMETEVAKELGKKEGLVISTGGHFMLDPKNIEPLIHTSRIFCLIATPDEILTRLQNDRNHTRPLLDVANPKKQIIKLLQQREQGYQRFPRIITDNKQPADIADNIFELIS